jgi:hypothetical protein
LLRLAAAAAVTAAAAGGGLAGLQLGVRVHVGKLGQVREDLQAAEGGVVVGQRVLRAGWQGGLGEGGLPEAGSGAAETSVPMATSAKAGEGRAQWRNKQGRLAPGAPGAWGRGRVRLPRTLRRCSLVTEAEKPSTRPSAPLYSWK